MSDQQKPKNMRMIAETHGRVVSMVVYGNRLCVATEYGVWMLHDDGTLRELLFDPYPEPPE